jgi:carbon storage regulator
LRRIIMEKMDVPGLVLTRAPNQKIMIGRAGEIIITVVSVRGDKVRLHVAAPSDVPVDREEIWLDKQGRRAEGSQRPEKGSSGA